MDTLTHALSGALVGRLLARRPSPSRPVPVWPMVVAGAIAGAFPDIDFILGYVSELTYLRNHRGVTHSLLLLPFWGLLVAGLMAWLLPRAAAGRTGWRDFYAVVCAGLAIHVAGDYITQFGTMMLAPLSDRRFGLGTVFIIDLVFTGIIVAGLLASALWRRSRWPAGVALLALAGWVGVTWVGQREALEAGQAYARANGMAAAAVAASPRPASPFNWTVLVDDGERYHIAHVNTRRKVALQAGPDDHFIRRLSAPYLPVAQAQWQVRERFGAAETDAGRFVHEVWERPEFAFFRWFAMFPVREDVQLAGQDGSCASFFDLRFDTPGREARPFRYGLCKSPPSSVSASASDPPSSAWRLFRQEAGQREWLTP